MSVEQQDSPIPPEGDRDAGDRFSSALKEFHAAESELFDAVTQWVRLPIDRHQPRMVEKATQIGRTYSSAVLELMNDKTTDYTYHEKAQQIATIFFESSEQRLSFFEAVAPKGNFTPPSQSRESMAEQIASSFANEEDDPTMTINQIFMSFSNELMIDFQALLNAVYETPRGKAIMLSRRLGGQALELGKLTAAVAIGGLITHGIVKKMEN